MRRPGSTGRGGPGVAFRSNDADLRGKLHHYPIAYSLDRPRPARDLDGVRVCTPLTCTTLPCSPQPEPPTYRHLGRDRRWTNAAGHSSKPTRRAPDGETWEHVRDK